jgi:hypothetical protein
VNRLPTVIGALVIASVIPILLIAAFGLIGTVAAVCIAVVAVVNMAGREVASGAALDFSVTYAPGKEDEVIGAVNAAADEIVRKIHAARPAAASTPQEGTTTP